MYIIVNGLWQSASPNQVGIRGFAGGRRSSYWPVQEYTIVKRENYQNQVVHLCVRTKQVSLNHTSIYNYHSKHTLDSTIIF